jgi:hypothetical protein
MPIDLERGDLVRLKTARSGWDKFVILGPSRKGSGWWRMSRIQASGYRNRAVVVAFKNDLVKLRTR